MNFFVVCKAPPVKVKQRIISENEPACKRCKYYINKHQNVHLNECTKFVRASRENLRFEFAEVCREQEDLCGPFGFYFELK